ncbi:MFS transporter [Micromonospora sp. WMMD998]|uniref:MFS transporter n=1 Tax=Micromonospora sp. WMMD998 TaxID=3016092 RepID=UPI00249C8902|nr:MFS transporter [Micromonospora sp. WMMD998]WFE41060.1 MFS transporter [Micromonospora sp. WMMD998]
MTDLVQESSATGRQRMPRAFWALWTGSLLNRLGYLIQPFLALFLSGRWHLSPGTVGLVLASFGAGAVVSQPLGGWLADRWGGRRTLVAGLLATAATAMTIPWAGTLPTLVGAVVLYGLTVDLYRPALAALVVATVPGEHRARAFGLIFWAVNLGSAVAGLAGGVMAERGFVLLFAADAASCVIFALVAVRLLPPDRRAGARDGGRGGAGPVSDALLWAVTGTFLVFAVLLVQAYVTMPLIMLDQGLPATAYGLVIAVNPIVILVVQPLLVGRLASWPRMPVYAGSLAVTGVGFGLLAAARDVPVYVLAVLVWTVGEIGVATVGPTLVTEIARPGSEGRYSGLFGMAYGASSLVGPLVGAAVLDAAGPTALWVTCAAAGVAAAAAAVALRGAVVRRTASARLG